MGNCCKCCDWIVDKARSVDDTPEESIRKEATIPGVVVGGLITGLSALMMPIQGWSLTEAFGVGLVLIAVTCAVTVIKVMLTKKMSMRDCMIELTLVTTGIFLIDWHNASSVGAARMWPLVVLVVDLALVVQVPPAFVKGIIHATALWIVINAVETANRFGFYDIEGWVEIGEDIKQKRAFCADPPCAQGNMALVNLVASGATVLYIDFMVTRGFADGMIRQQDRIQTSIETAEQVTSALARFKLESAEAVMENAGEQLPEELADSFRILIANLGRYRPYLPQSCMPVDEDEQDEQDETNTRQSCVTEVTTTTLAIVPPDSPGTPSTVCGSFKNTPNAMNSFASVGSLKREETGTRSNVLKREESGSRLKTDELNVIPRRPSPWMARKSGAGSMISEGSANQSPRRSVHSRTSVFERNRASRAQPKTLAEVHLLKEPIMKRISLLVSNRHGFLTAAQKAGSAGVSDWFTLAVEQFGNAVQEEKGILDSLSGDHMFATFGAARNNPQHRICAARAAAAIVQTKSQAGSALSALKCTTVACSGLALCGDFGSAVVQRFLMIGYVSLQSHMMERIATQFGYSAVIDGLIHNDCSHYFELILRKLLYFPKQTSAKAAALWEIEKEKDGARCSQGEWMYALNALSTSSRWEGYNNALLAWADGNADKALGIISSAGAAGEDVAVHTEELRTKVKTNVQVTGRVMGYTVVPMEEIPAKEESLTMQIRPLSHVQIPEIRES